MQFWLFLRFLHTYVYTLSFLQILCWKILSDNLNIHRDLFFIPWTFSPEKLVKKDWCLLCLWCKTKKSTKSVTSKRWRPNAFWVQNWVVFAKSIKGKPYPLREGILETCKDNILEYEKNCMVRTKDTISWKKGAKNTVQSGVTSERKIKTLITQKVWKLRQ